MTATQSGTITIETRPEPIRIQPAKTTLLVIDMQNDFGAKGGMVDRAEGGHKGDSHA